MHDATLPATPAQDPNLKSYGTEIVEWFRAEPKRLVFAILGILFVLILIAALLTSARPEQTATSAYTPSIRPMPIELDFTVGRGEGLTRHVSYQRSVDIAERFGLPIYLGRQQHRDAMITPALARKLEEHTAQQQVTVGVRPGTRFELRDVDDSATWRMF